MEPISTEEDQDQDPPSSYSETPQGYEDELFHAATISLNSYNSKHQFQFELAHPLHMEVFRGPSKSSCPYAVSLYKHLSFIARSRESSGVLKLFFAEVCNHTIVNTCVPVEPGNPLFALGCEECHPDGVIYHPLGKYKAGDYRDYESPHPGELEKLEASAKKFLEEMYTFKYIIQDLYPEEEKELRKATNRFARRALAWYEEDTKSSFQFLEPVACVLFSDEHVQTADLDCKVYVHLTFKARNKDPGFINSPAELFFAELNLEYGWVTTCVNVTEMGSSECAVCSKYCPMPHPKVDPDDPEYEAGLKGGTFADAQVKGRSYGAKVELQEKLGTSSNAARFIGLSSVLSAKQSGVLSSPRKVDCQALSTNCLDA